MLMGLRGEGGQDVQYGRRPSSLGAGISRASLEAGESSQRGHINASPMFDLGFAESILGSLETEL